MPNYEMLPEFFREVSNTDEKEVGPTDFSALDLSSKANPLQEELLGMALNHLKENTVRNKLIKKALNGATPLFSGSYRALHLKYLERGGARMVENLWGYLRWFTPQSWPSEMVLLPYNETLLHFALRCRSLHCLHYLIFLFQANQFQTVRNFFGQNVDEFAEECALGNIWQEMKMEYQLLYSDDAKEEYCPDHLRKKVYEVYSKLQKAIRVNQDDRALQKLSYILERFVEDEVLSDGTLKARLEQMKALVTNVMANHPVLGENLTALQNCIQSPGRSMSYRPYPTFWRKLPEVVPAEEPLLQNVAI